MIAGYYAGDDPTNVSWQASQIPGGSRHYGVTDHTRWSNTAQQGRGKISEPQKTVLHLLFVVICRQNNGCHVC